MLEKGGLKHIMPEKHPGGCNLKNIKTQIGIAPEVGCTLKNIKMQIGTRVPIGGGGPYPKFSEKFPK